MTETGNTTKPRQPSTSRMVWLRRISQGAFLLLSCSCSSRRSRRAPTNWVIPSSSSSISIPFSSSPPCSRPQSGSCLWLSSSPGPHDVLGRVLLRLGLPLGTLNNLAARSALAPDGKPRGWVPDPSTTSSSPCSWLRFFHSNSRGSSTRCPSRYGPSPWDLPRLQLLGDGPGRALQGGRQGPLPPR